MRFNHEHQGYEEQPAQGWSAGNPSATAELWATAVAAYQADMAHSKVAQLWRGKCGFPFARADDEYDLMASAVTCANTLAFINAPQAEALPHQVRCCTAQLLAQPKVLQQPRLAFPPMPHCFSRPQQVPRPPTRCCLRCVWPDFPSSLFSQRKK